MTGNPVKTPASAGSATTSVWQQYSLSDAEFERLCRLVQEHVGIALGESKRELVYSRLARRLRKLELRSFAEYCRLLESRDADEIEEFINAITTNLTSFFREEHHFEHLATVLPELEARNAATRRIRIWSAGCSTGEEPYSIAMVVLETLGHLRGWDIRILATDVDSNVLATGRSGEYTGEKLERVSGARRQRWFATLHGGADRMRVSPELESIVVFKPLNLMQPWPMRGPFDVIFCRNVVIYFDKETQTQLFERMADLQPIGGHLYIGHSESLYRVTRRYQLIDKTTYVRMS